MIDSLTKKEEKEYTVKLTEREIGFLSELCFGVNEIFEHLYPVFKSDADLEELGAKLLNQYQVD